MAKVDREGHGGGGERKPALGTEQLGGASHAVLTVADARVNIRIGDRMQSLLEFEEFPEFAYWLNKTGVDNLCEALGDESDEWIGQRVPLELVTTNNPQTGRTVKKYWVPSPDAWEEIFDEYDSRRKPKAKPKAKRGRKR